MGKRSIFRGGPFELNEFRELNQVWWRKCVSHQVRNNLFEYFGNVNFFKPKLLDTFSEFKNRFVNPIQNGVAAKVAEVRNSQLTVNKREFLT